MPNYFYFFHLKKLSFLISAYSKTKTLLLLLFLQPPPNKNIKKKWCSQQEGKLFQPLHITKNLNPESGTEPAGNSHDEIGFQNLVSPAKTTNNKQVARPFFLAFLNCIDSNHLLIISLLGFLKLLYYYVHKKLQPFWK